MENAAVQMGPALRSQQGRSSACNDTAQLQSKLSCCLSPAPGVEAGERVDVPG